MRKIIRAIFILPFAIAVSLPCAFLWWLLQGDTWKKAIWRQKEFFWDWLIIGN